MSMQPHLHKVDEVKKAIASIEHNESGTGPGPSGKKAGPPSDSGGGSGSNDVASDSVVPKRKGADWLASMSKK